MADSIKIMVRVRPFNERELTNNFKNIVEMQGQQMRLTIPDSNEQARKFAFHRCYYSTDDAMGHAPVNNKQVFDDIGMQILDCIYQGYNSTIFAYGQTGSGKSYSIQGKQDEKGILQMCLEDIFLRKIPQNQTKGLATSVKVTYLEIYNEKLRDLVNPVERDIRVIQQGTAITIHGVDPFPISSYEDVEKVFLDGKKVRVVGAHAMNKNSSRSHAIFTIHYKQTGKGKMIDAKFNIVDLAGSQRQSKTGATGKRLEEANKINNSLTNLGIVIEKLAHNCQNKKSEFIPYRNSLLTHILSESLSGNSKTFMIAAISPADDNYQQSLGTLRFAQRASLITTQSKKNVSAKQGYNKQLLEEIERLKKQLQGAAKGGEAGPHSHTVSVEYITVEKEAAEADSKIAEMMKELQRNKLEKEALQNKLAGYEKEKQELEAAKANNTINPQQLLRLAELTNQVVVLKEEINTGDKTRQELQAELGDQKSKRESLNDELMKAKGQLGEQQTKSAELNARIAIMMMQFEQTKTDREQLLRELEEQRKMKQEIEMNRKKLLDEAGLSSQAINDRKLPYIMNVSEDPTLLGMLLYDLKAGETKVGTKDGEQNQVKLNVLGIMPRHCSLFNQKGNISIQPNSPEAKVFVNGALISKKKELNHLDRITLGHANNFKLIIPGKGSPNDLRQSMANTGQFGQFLDDKLAANTIQAKSMKQFLLQLQQRLDKHLFNKFIQKFQATLQDIGQMNQYTFLRYRKFPLKNKNVSFRMNVLVDIENYMKGVPQLVIICQHNQSKEVQFIWAEEKFQKRLEVMESWYEGSDNKGQNVSHQFDPWFEADDEFIQQKAKLENMKQKQILQMWHNKQQENAQIYKKVLQEQKLILAELKSLGYAQSIVEDYADFYFRNFPPAQSLKAKLQAMRKKEDVHKRIQRFMECCAEVQKCNMDNKFFNLQKDKYGNKQNQKMKDVGKTLANSIMGLGGPAAGQGGIIDEGILQENVYLSAKLQELQDELKKRTQLIHKLKKERQT